MPWFVMWYDFYPMSCVFSIPTQRLGDRKHTSWMKIISHHKTWEILFITPYLFLLTLFFGGRGDTQCDIKKNYHMSGITFISRINWSRSTIFHLHGDITITGEGLQNLGLCSVLREGTLLCHICCDTGSRFFWSHPKDRPLQSLFYDTLCHKGKWRIYSNLDWYQRKYVINIRYNTTRNPRNILTLICT
jgi:hypothetical protein